MSMEMKDSSQRSYSSPSWISGGLFASEIGMIHKEKLSKHVSLLEPQKSWIPLAGTQSCLPVLLRSKPTESIAFRDFEGNRTTH